MFEVFGTFKTSREQFDRFKSGALWREWANKHPELFDADDTRVANTQAKMGYHYHEWLAALLVYKSIGYLSLIESYEFKVQKRKQEILKQVVPASVLATIQSITKEGKVQCPDLLCYSPDLSDWFFCEVKGPNDKMRDIQEQTFQRLVNISEKNIQVVSFTY